MLKIVYYTDPGHGWFAVKTKLVYQLNIEDKISPYSYVRGKTVYLEEDCDAETLFNALKAHSIEYKLEYKHTNNRSRIRSYDRFKMDTVQFFKDHFTIVHIGGTT
jgi:hypothetical protein